MTPQEETDEGFRRLEEELRKNAEANAANADATAKAKDANLKLENATGMVMGAFQKLLDVQLKYQVAMAKGAKGSAQFNDGVDAMTDSMQMAVTALSLLVPGGILIKGVVAGLTFLATNAMKASAAMQKAANEQGDALKKAYDTMSKSGATASDGMTGLFKDVNRMRLNVHQLDAMAGVMANSGKEMASMGGTVYKARKQFGDLVQGMGAYEKGMLNLGMSYDEQAEAAMGYMKLQSNLTQGQQKDYGKLAGGMKKYLQETEALARVTGVTRKEQEAAQEKYMAQQRFGAKIQELRDENTVESNRAADLLISGMKKAAAQGEQFGQAYADSATQMLTSDAAIRGNMSTGGKMQESINDILEGRIKTEEDANASFQGVIESTKEMGKIFNKTYQTGVGEDFLLPFKEMRDVTKSANQNFADQIADAAKEVGKLIESTDGVDAQLLRYNAMLKRQNEVMMATQKDLNDKFMDSGVAAGGFMDKLTKAFQPLIDRVNKLVHIWTPLVEGLGDMLIGALSMVVKFMTGDVMGGLTDFKDGWDSAAKGLEETADRYATQLISDVKSFGGNLLKSVEFITGPLGPVFENLGKNVTDGLDKFSNALVDMVANLWQKLTAMIPDFGSVGKVAGNVAGTVKGAAGAAGDYLSSAFSFGGSSTSTASASGGRGSAPSASRSAAPASRSAAPAAPVSSASSASVSSDPGGKPPADKPVRSQSGDEVQMGDSVRIGNEIRKGGTVSWRTNNPGNGSYSGITKQYGALGTWKNPKGDKQQRGPGIAIFPSLDEGEKYKIAQWLRPMYVGKTIDQGAQQWAEAAHDFGPGSPYAKGLAKAAGVPLDTVVGTLTDSQLKSMTRYQSKLEGFREGQVIQAATGGIFDGPKSGYAATLHGNEAVIPLKDGAVPVSMSQEFNMTAANLGELVNIMKNNVGMQASMLAVLEDIKRSQNNVSDHTGRMAAYASN